MLTERDMDIITNEAQAVSWKHERLFLVAF